MKSIFYSTLKDKRDMLRRLEEANMLHPNSDIEDAILVVRDSILLHDAHKTFQFIIDAIENKNLRVSGADIIVVNIEDFYRRLQKNKKKLRLY
jgi:hypothetical protein